MVPETQITEIAIDGMYEVAHHLGPTYEGASAGHLFIRGRPMPAEPIPGWRVIQTGLATIAHLWAVRPGHEVRHDGEGWVYAPRPPSRPARPEPEPDRPVKQRAKKRAKKGAKK